MDAGDAFSLIVQVTYEEPEKGGPHRKERRPAFGQKITSDHVVASVHIARRHPVTDGPAGLAR
jgi:hypothetical protein